MYIHEIIKERRKQLKMSQTELAVNAETTQHSISLFERGKLNITIDSLSRILCALSLDIELIEKKIRENKEST